MKQSSHTIFRQECAAPTEPGFYYARWKKAGHKELWEIFPAAVFWAKVDELAVEIREDWQPTTAFSWFGPVPTCVEG